MTLENIVKYATQTPQNTDPAVMSSVISQSFKETKEEIKQELGRTGGIGYIEPQKVFTCDGNPNGENVNNGLYKISDKVLDLTKFTTAIGFVDGVETILQKEEFVSSGGVVTADFIGDSTGSFIAATSEHLSDNYPVGTYIWCDEYGYVSYIEFEGTVHPIDQKYLAKEINLTDYGIDVAALVMSNTTAKKISGTKKMWDEINGSKDIVLTGAFGTATFKLVPSACLHEGAFAGKASLISAAFMVMNSGVMLSISLQLVASFEDDDYSDETDVYCLVTTTAIT